MLFAGLPLLLAGCGGASGGSGGSTVTSAITLSVASLSFGTVGVGTTTVAQAVTVTNSGSTNVTISTPAVTGDFAATNDCGTSLIVGKSCMINVVFTPTAVGARAGTLSLTDSAAGSPQTVALSGTGGTPTDTITPASISFGTVATGSTSSVQIVTLTSTGTAPLAISGVVVSGDYTRASNTCTASLAVNANCQVGIMFVPMATGARTGSLTVTTNAAGSPQVIALSGTGTAPVASSGLPFKITVQAGTQVVSGATVQIFAAGSTGNGSAATSLLTTALTTDATGTVSVPAGFQCPSAAALVYAVASGGVVGAAAANSNIRLLTAIGPCSSITSGAKYTVNEATTVAAAYALAPFYTGVTSIGATGTNLIGLTNAFATAASLADTIVGTSPGSTMPSNASSPAARIYSLANLINACTVSAANCAGLYSATTATAAPTNTFDAVVNLARAPATNTSTIYTLAQKSAAFSPALTAVPADWTMFVNLSGGGMNSPSSIGVDSQGAVWVASYFYIASKFTPVGAPVFPTGVTQQYLNNSYGLAIDLNDQVWIANEQPYTGAGTGSVTVFSSAGASVGAYGYGGMNYPLSVAIDPNGTTWVVQYGNSHVSLLNSLGTPISGTDGYTTDLFAFPVAVAIDANHYGWIANQSGANVTKVSPDGKTFVNYSCCNGASGIALDQGNNVWVANFYGDSVSLISNTGTVVGNATYTASGGLYRPQGIALDGAGNVWVANYRGSYISELSGVSAAVPGASLSPSTGFGSDAQLVEAYGLAVDASGNIWVSNQGSNLVTKFIGMAVPVKTPLSGIPRLP